MMGSRLSRVLEETRESIDSLTLELKRASASCISNAKDSKESGQTRARKANPCVPAASKGSISGPPLQVTSDVDSPLWHNLTLALPPTQERRGFENIKENEEESGKAQNAKPAAGRSESNSAEKRHLRLRQMYNELMHVN